MPSVEQNERLLRLERHTLDHTIRSDPNRSVYFNKLPVGKEPLLIEFWTAAREVTDAEAAELYSALAAPSLFDIKQNGQLEIRGSLRDELAVFITVHKYARMNPAIQLPFFSDLLKPYVFHTTCRLFEKYGWNAGQSDSSNIRPLRDWTRDDRRCLVEMFDQVSAAPCARMSGNSARLGGPRP
jgi:hypothetical protein